MLGALLSVFGIPVLLNNNKSTYFVIMTKTSQILLYSQYTPMLGGVNTKIYYIILLFIGYYHGV